MTTIKRPTLEDQQEFYRWMLFGDPGRGKTPHIAAAAKYGRVIYIDADGGLKKSVLMRHGIPVKNIEPYTDISYEGLKNLHLEVLMRLKDGEDIFAVAWDTASKTQEHFTDETMATSLEKAERLARARGEESTRNEFEVYLDERGIVVEKMKKLLRRFHGLPCHLIIGAHQRKDTDDEGKIVVGPGLSPSVVASFSGWMDCIIHCRTTSFPDDTTLLDQDGIEFSGLTRPEGKYIARDRFGALPKNMVDPNVPRILGYLKGELVKEKDPLQLAARARRSKQNVVASEDGSSTDEPVAVE